MAAVDAARRPVDADRVAAERVAERRRPVGPGGAPGLRAAVAVGDALVEDVEAALALRLPHEAHFFQKIGPDVRGAQPAPAVELEGDPLAEAARVVVAQRPRVAEALQDGVRLEHLRLDAHRRRRVAAVARAHDDGQAREVAHDEFRRLRLARAGLAGDEHGLVGHGLLVRGRGRALEERAPHGPVGLVRDGEGVGRRRGGVLGVRVAGRADAPVRRDGRVAVELGQPLERVHGQEDRADVRVDEALLRALLEHVEDRRLVEEGQQDQVLDALVAALVPHLHVRGQRLVARELELPVLPFLRAHAEEDGGPVVLPRVDDGRLPDLLGVPDPHPLPGLRHAGKGCPVLGFAVCCAAAALETGHRDARGQHERARPRSTPSSRRRAPAHQLSWLSFKWVWCSFLIEYSTLGVAASP